jgi:hypothetical protein
MERSRDEMAQASLDIATAMIMDLEKAGCDAVTAYAAFGSAFHRMHTGLGKSKEDWLETTKQMADHLPQASF